MIRPLPSALIALLMPVHIGAQIPWPEQPQNLQVLPAGTTTETLRNTMFGFSDALGVNCTHCHVARDRNDWSTYDFASDEKSHKQSARIMLRMVAAINGEHLAKLGFGHGNTIQVTCRTCHHGQDRPISLEARLWDTIESGGVQAGVTAYQRLREQDYGRGKFDFGEGSLNALGYRLLLGGRTIDAIAIFELNVAQFPDAAKPHDSLGEAYMQAGRREKAIASYRKSLVLTPTTPTPRSASKP